MRHKTYREASWSLCNLCDFWFSGIDSQTVTFTNVLGVAAMCAVVYGFASTIFRDFVFISFCVIYLVQALK